MSNIVLIVCNASEENQSYYQNLAERLSPEELHIITDEEALKTIQNKTFLQQINLCLLQVELNWGNHRPLHFYGFEIAKKLRNSGLVANMALFTLYKVSNFEALKPRYALLRIPAYHHLFQIPLDPPEQLDQIQSDKMSEFLREDLVDTLLNIGSLVHEVLHDLKNGVILPTENNQKKNETVVFQAIEHSFSELITLLPAQEGKLKTIEKKLKAELSKALESQLETNNQEIVDIITAEILTFVPFQKKEAENLFTQRTRWKVLIVEDEENVRKKLEEGFRENKINFKSVGTAEEAFEILERDQYRNEFTVLLCDIRLKYPGTEKWQRFQGYDIIEKVKREFSNLLAFFALTSGKKRLLHLAKTSKTNINSELKKDVLSAKGALNIFIRKLRQAGDDVFFKSRSRPQLSAWRKKTTRFYKALGQFYRDHLFASDYEESEDNINQQALQYIHKGLSGQLTKLDKIEFVVNLGKPRDDEDELLKLEKFRDRILVGRRIALGLFINDLSEDNIFDIMHLNAEAEIDNRQASKNFLFKTTLALSFLKDFPPTKKIKEDSYLHSNLLLEEIQFLITHLDANLDMEQIRLNQVDRDNCIMLLGDIQYTIQNKLQLHDDNGLPSDKKLATFLATKVDKVSNIKQFKKLFIMADGFATEFEVKNKFYEYIREELDSFTNQELKTFLTGLTALN